VERPRVLDRHRAS